MPDLVIHAFTDGRDTSPTGGEDFLATVEDWCTVAGNARIGTVIGRYFAMDRDKRWDRLQQAYDLLVHGRAEHHAPNAPAAARDAYDREETDEFITATTVGDEARIRPGDSVIAFNFRPDRMREISRALAEPGFTRRRPRRRAGRRALRTPDRVRGGLALPGRLPARAPEHHAAARRSPRTAGASCTSPRPRSTRT